MRAVGLPRGYCAGSRRWSGGRTRRSAG